jgi:hypothetical protein
MNDCIRRRASADPVDRADVVDSVLDFRTPDPESDDSLRKPELDPPSRGLRSSAARPDSKFPVPGALGVPGGLISRSLLDRDERDQR